MNCSLPGFPDLHYLPEFVHTQVHWAGDAIQPSHPLSLPSPPALNLSQHQGLSDEPSLPTRWPKYWSFSFSISPSVSASVLPVNIQGWFPLGMTGLTSLLSKDSDEPSTSQFESINSSIVSFPYGPTLTPYKTTGKNVPLTIWIFVSKVVSLLFNILSRRRQWHPTPVLLPGKSHRWRSLVGCSPWGHWELDTTWATSLSIFTFMHWRRKWQPTPVFLPGESQGWGSLVGCCLWGHTDWSDLAAAAAAGWS